MLRNARSLPVGPGFSLYRVSHVIYAERCKPYGLGTAFDSWKMTTDFDVAFAIVSVGANAIQDPVMFAAIFAYGDWRVLLR
jgi:hypothetical protein